ncbi:MAG: RnfABCDGE type electron transport complex subunit D [Candidatus Omnitrophota bacterium]
MNKTLVISPAPHFKSGLKTSRIMLEVILALIPAIAAAIYFFGWRSVWLIVTCVVSCTATEAIFEKTRGMKNTLPDYSAVLTGILLALVLPPAIPLWAAALGGIISICLAKQLFGGLGYNIFNPALIGRAFLTASFPAMMTAWINPFSLDTITSATPLGLMKFSGIETSLKSLFFGNVGGCLGETSALALLIGGIYLIIRKLVKWRVVAGFLGSVFIFSLAAWIIKPQLGSPLFHLLSGGIMIGAFFMATDPVTSPVTKKGCFMFGAGAGIMVMVIRIFGGLPEGVMYSILLMNGVTPLINKFTVPRPFGGQK